MRRKKEPEQDAQATTDPRLTPLDIQQAEFRLAFRGYRERDVDAFLDRITEDLTAYLEEIERLRSAPAASASAQDGTAEETLARARAEADEIVRAAREQAAAIGAGAAVAAGSGGADARAAVAPFLSSEREFLQSLGGLVQGHAEEIKGMVLALRARSEGPTVAETPQARPAESVESAGSVSPAAQPAGSAAATERPEPQPASTAEIRERLGADEPSAPVPAEPDTIVVESATEPAFAPEGAPVGDRRERSLRELFWGDD
jgi:DivIVA domain-containing protein